MRSNTRYRPPPYKRRPSLFQLLQRRLTAAISIPVTRALSDKNPTIPAEVQAGNPPLTAAQQAEAARQKQIADIQAKKAEARKKYQDAEKARKDREDAAKSAEQQRIATLKVAREARVAEMKQDREQLAALKQEEITARKAYQDAKKNATGDSVRQIETDYQKAEKDRQAKIKELRHPKYKPLKAYESGQGSPNGTTALPGTVTSGSGATVTQH